MDRQPLVDAFVRRAGAADVKDDVRDEEAEKDRQTCDQDEPCKHPREKDDYRMSGAETTCDAFRDTAAARLEDRYTPIARPVREGTVPFKSCAHRVRLPGRTQG